MTATPLTRQALFPLIPVVGVGAVVLCVASLLAAQAGFQVGLGAMLIAVALYVASEGLASPLGIDDPLSRMLFTMLVRGGGAMAAVLIAVTALNHDPKLVALIAMPSYLSLIAGEVIGATQSAALGTGIGQTAKEAA